MAKDLEASLFALASFKNRFEAAIKVFKRYPLDDDQKWTTSGYLLILICGFLEEWGRFSSFRSLPDVEETTNVTKVALRRVRQWEKLQAFRNSVLAHSTRTKTGTLTDIDALLSAGMPRYGEILLMAELAHLCAAVAMKRHASVYEPAKARFLSRSVSEPTEFGINTKEEFNGEMKKFYEEMLNIDPSLKSIKDRSPWWP